MVVNRVKRRWNNYKLIDSICKEQSTSLESKRENKRTNGFWLFNDNQTCHNHKRKGCSTLQTYSRLNERSVFSLEASLLLFFNLAVPSFFHWVAAWGLTPSPRSAACWAGRCWWGNLELWLRGTGFRPWPYSAASVPSAARANRTVWRSAMRANTLKSSSSSGVYLREWPRVLSLAFLRRVSHGRGCYDAIKPPRKDTWCSEAHGKRSRLTHPTKEKLLLGAFLKSS